MTIYTDGASSKNGDGGWAFVAVLDNVIITERSGRDVMTTNNRMELMAIIQAMQWMLADGTKHLIVTDSMYAKDIITKHWHQPKTNLELVRAARSLHSIVECHFQWVKGHTGNRWNEYVDKLAGKAKRRAESYYLADIPPPTG